MPAFYMPIGGKVFVVLEIKVGPGERVDPIADTIGIEVTEEDSIHNPYPPAIRRAGPHSQLNCFNLNGGGQWEKKVEPCNADSIWLPLDAGETPKTANLNNPSPVVYRAKVLWDTTQVPLGHNARHKLHATINADPATNQLTFQRYDVTTDWQPPYSAGPAVKRVEVKNLVIRDSIGNAGNPDYIKFDPESDDQELREPKITFNITDEGDPHAYEWWVYLRDTSAEDWTVRGYVEISGSTDGPEAVTATWNGLGPDGLPAEKGAYTFDIYVRESDGETPCGDIWLKHP